jgi:Protein of unknown function (DUF2971)
MQLPSDQKRLWEIFHPKAAEEEARILDKDVRFVHYTRADTALKILRDKEIWMRKATCMSDFSEVQHGLDCLDEAYNKSQIGKWFQSTLNGIFEGFSETIARVFTSWIPLIKFNTYITCFAEHTKEQDKYGRLSMWRAYAANSGVAIVLNNSAFKISPDVLWTFLSPVAYLEDTDVQQELERIRTNITANTEFIKAQGSMAITSCVLRMFLFGSVSIKNPCFREEMEWRLVHSDGFSQSQFLRKANESIQGIPQPIYRFPLRIFLALRHPLLLIGS